MTSKSKYFLFYFAHLISVAVVLKILNFIVPQCLICCFSNIVTVVGCLIFTKYTFNFTKQKLLNEKIHPDGKAIFITGCDSGFGHYLAQRLDSRGFHVFASCLFPSGPGANDLKKLCSDKLKVLELDVTKDESVDKALQMVKENLGHLKLWAIVNNAGIQKGFSVDLTCLKDFKDTMEVNAFGMVRVTKAFLQLLKQSRGRVVNLTSLNGRCPVPHVTPYVMSKFAASGFSDCLRMEMDDWGIRVIQIEPETFKTRITEVDEVSKRLDSVAASMNFDLKNEYGEEYFKKFRDSVESYLRKFASPKVYKVVNDMESAICSKYPDFVYRPSRNDFAKIILYLFDTLPYSWKDLILKIGLYFLSFPKPAKA